ncbi:MAG TPA: hypothetical protein VF668_01180 [Pyrinomonadaceae bacterium]|jgi:chromosome segregation ATPase
MTDLTLITAAVAAASAAGFLFTLALAALLTLTVTGLARKARRLQRELSQATSLKRGQAATIRRLSREKASLTFENARLDAAVSDLLTQRRVLGFALFDVVDELEATEADLRSANRQRLSEQKRGDRILEDLCKANSRAADLAESLDMTQSMFVAAQAEKRRLRREVEELEGELGGLDVQAWLDRICPVPALSDFLLPDERLSVEVSIEQVESSAGDIVVTFAADGRAELDFAVRSFTTEQMTGGGFNPTV